MRKRYLSLAAAAALTFSCASHTRTSSAKPAAAPQPMMERQIRNAIDAGDGNYLIRTLRAQTAAEPDNIDARMQLARAYREAGYPDLALEHCRLAAQRFPESGAVQLGMARALREMGLRKEALEGLEAFLKKHPQKTPDYLSWVGILRDELELWPAGEAAHRAALEMLPTSDYLHNNLGYNLLKQNKNAEAAAEFREALKLNPHSEVARNNLGLTLANQDANEQAVLYWQSASDPATAHSNMAAYLIEKGEYKQARQELDVALGYNRQHPAALKNLQLVSRLDGTPATMILTPATGSRWTRFRSSFLKLWVGPLQDQPAGAATAAPPSHLTGENR